MAGLVPAIPIITIRPCHWNRDRRDKPGDDERCMETPMVSDTPTAPRTAVSEFLQAIWLTVGGEPAALSALEVAGEGDLPSAFAVTDMATAAAGAAALAVAELVGT